MIKNISLLFFMSLLLGLSFSPSEKPPLKSVPMEYGPKIRNLGAFELRAYYTFKDLHGDF